ncbi:WD40/YVTN/BNR-like repeat-containing protein [Tunturiibacter psychrotolerans]|uniref:WD40/YVTN/BNR-like repeat-containing protein n=1 Tax=Tunturiibacter psychrotolerans TaxID=3069686 RepID=UPI003D1C741B
MRSVLLLLSLVLAATQATSRAYAQWDLEESHTTASLRGIHNVGGGVAWASGTDGTVLRTEDGGYLWQTCAIPPGAEKLDFRGVQAFDENTAIVMSSGPGDQSRLYKTTDGCQTWKLVFTNPDKDGFFDGISLFAPSQDALGHPLDHSHVTGYVIGDPVEGAFALFSTRDGGNSWSRRIATQRGSNGAGCKVDTFAAKSGEAAFAASNQSLLTLNSSFLLFVTGGSDARIGYTDLFSLDGALCHESAHFKSLPITHGNPSSGAFAFAVQPGYEARSNFPDKIVVVGGDYKLPGATNDNAVLVSRVGNLFQTSKKTETPPHGYRSAVAWDADQKLWITVGPNGTDISTDDGKNWRPLTPLPTDPADADKNWNALSLPFVVGPHGRIGRLRTIDQKSLATKKP